MFNLEFPTLFWLFGLCILLNVGLTACVVSRLKNRHPDLWEEAGSPFLLRPRSVGDFQFLRFLAKLRFLGVQDALLTVLCVLTLVTYAFALILFIRVWLLAGQQRIR